MSRSVTISCRSFNDLQNKVQAIKAVRGLSGLGLREAKELVERVTPGHAESVPIGSYVLEPFYSEHIESLRQSGLTVTASIHNNVARKGIASEIRKLVTYATMTAQYDIGRALLDLMETYCPDPEDEHNEEIKDDDE